MRRFRALFSIVLPLIMAASGQALAAPVKILALGTSLTQGYGLPPGTEFPVQLQAALRKVGIDAVVINAGVSGDTSAGGLARLDWSVADKPDAFTYDPANPVMSYGGNVCCTGNAITAGSFDQRKSESRHDVLVYTSEPFAEGIEVSGPIVPTLYVSSDAKDTDFTVKVLDVYPDGRAYNLDESIQRMRYRDGYDKPPVWMEKDKVYKVTLQPLNTSNFFAAGHRLRIEVSSSNFPRFDRNLNTGGNNYDEAKGVVARNVVYHSKQYPSSITITVVRKPAGSSPQP